MYYNKTENACMLNSLIKALPSTAPSNLTLFAQDGTFEEPAIILCLVQSADESERIRHEMDSFTEANFYNLDEVSCQTIQSFFNAHLQAEHDKNIETSGINKFRKWCAAEEKKTSSNVTLKKNSLNFFKDILKETCKIPFDKETSKDQQQHIYYYLYLELQMLAPFNGYADEEEVRVTQDRSFFTSHADIIIEDKIEKVLRDYRAWMLEKNLVDPAISDLSTLPYKKLQWFNGLLLTHIVWSANENISSNIIYHLKKMAPTIIAHTPDKKLQVIDGAWRKLHTLQQFQTETWLSQTHHTISDLSESEVKETSPRFFSFLLQQNDSYIRAFAKKIIHYERYMIFLFLVKNADLNNAGAVHLIEILLACLENTISETLSPNIFSDETQHQDERMRFYHYQKEIFRVLLNKKLKIKNNLELKVINEKIFRLPFFLFHAISSYTINSFYLYYYMLRILENSTIENKKDLIEIYHFFKKIHQHSLLKTRLSEDSTHPNTVQTWETMRRIYLIAINICMNITTFSSFFETAINLYALVMEHRQTFAYNNPQSIQWHAETYKKTWQVFANELEFAEKNQCVVAENFFDQIFEFAENNPIQKTWNNNDKQDILNMLFDFLEKSAPCNFKSIREQSKLAFSWEKMKTLFKKDAFDLSDQNTLNIFIKIDEIFVAARALTLPKADAAPKTYAAWCTLLSNSPKATKNEPIPPTPL